MDIIPLLESFKTVYIKQLATGGINAYLPIRGAAIADNAKTILIE